ncbi:Dimethyl sulfoxide/trimethylamine N-oxide reductase [Paraburkholderia aspalathi]|uniref:Dimethyl sulfoxide/trimethylamine N-oxide reductase n=1 Tax=Paraburkholderia aspalathi TaxID=1324617 RepID=A0ABM8SZX9_9BURK|nr:molybdopterin-dependent oxidoreductase [Paraburkholderia aspalathi]MBK3835068.1 molybdopterin-dependent oxidoreductase [Paraburkholderia aspalathi]MBK3864840.1 molybdopterin-dependent oxidoreductase [Paraburkholderia aspalathi]CAE6845213.1 Dimethyl sulfoxide/trimethylamine N-oxide reductase [Paraburkholderia aspalathi]
MLRAPARPIVATHWGTYRVKADEGAQAQLEGYELDEDPSPIASAMLEARTHASRIKQPMVREGFLEHGHHGGEILRGQQRFVPVSWHDAIRIVSGQLERVREEYGNESIYGGSYGWASAGRFHHAQSQIHRFLNVIGGYTASVQNYSYAAADVIVPHVIGSKAGLVSGHTSWRSIIESSELVVMFGGAPRKNAQVNSGGIGRHILRPSLMKAHDAGVEFVLVSPIRDDVAKEVDARWIAVRPNTDVALMLGIAHTLITESKHDVAFLERYCIGFEKFESYVMGKNDDLPKSARWASEITDISEETIRKLALEMARKRTMIMMSWSLQRADHGEQPYWMAITLAAMLGQIGLPGGGFGFGYGSVNGIGNEAYGFSWPSLPQGKNAVTQFIPVARVADMLLNPGAQYDYNGVSRTFPDIKCVYWAGGNPFHHHQDLNRLVRAWQKPEVIVVHESWWNACARHADIVLPVTTQLERNDIVCSGRDRFVTPSHRLHDPAGESKDDYEIFSLLARSMGVEFEFTEGRDEEDWLRHLYGIALSRVREAGLTLPDFDVFWQRGICELPEPPPQADLLAEFRNDPVGNVLRTPSGKIEIFSEKIDSFGYDDCPGHPAWLEPYEWLGASAVQDYPLHLISNQPATKLHSQYDLGTRSMASKIHGREPIRIHPDDAAARGILDGEVVRVFNARGALLAGVSVSCEVRRGVVQIATGAWYDPVEPGMPCSLDKHGNPNVLTRDKGTSRLAQGVSAHSCLVEIVRFTGHVPPITAFSAPQAES